MRKRDLSESKEVLQLKKKIEDWKANRITTNTKMPEQLWAQAAKYGELYGTSSVSKFLKIGYVALKKQQVFVEASSTGKKPDSSKRFIELPPVAFHTPSLVMEVLLANPEGESATIRCPDPATDWEKVFSGWFKASRSSQKGRVQ